MADERRGGRGDDGQRRRTGRRGAGPRDPVGLDRATRTPGAPPRRTPAPAEPPARPELPDDVDVDLPRSVRRELRRSVTRAEDAEEAARCLAAATPHLEERQGEPALAYLRWAKHLAPRSATVREALGVALYLAEDYAGALSELQAYRRFTGNVDQNHLVADCHRALGRDPGKVAELVEPMRGDPDVPLDRRVEGVIVWASTLADGGDVGAGRAVLRPVLDELDKQEPEEPHLRLWYVAGDLAERAGDPSEARAWFTRIDEAAEGFFDVDERLERL